MVSKTYSADEIDKSNNQQQGLLLLDYLLQAGYGIGVRDDSLIITAPNGVQNQTSVELRSEEIVKYAGPSVKASPRELV